MTHPIHSADAEQEHAAFITEYRLWKAQEAPDAHPEMVHSMAESHWQRAAGAMWLARAARAAAQVGAIGAADSMTDKLQRLQGASVKHIASLAAGAPAETPKPDAALLPAVLALNTAIHQALVAGGDYGDDISDTHLRDTLKKAQHVAFRALISIGIEKLPGAVNPLRAFLPADEVIPTPAATIGAGEGKDTLDAARWRFMMRVSDNVDGPESVAMEEFADEMFSTDRPKSEQLSELIDRAAAAMRSKTSPGEAG